MAKKDKGFSQSEATVQSAYKFSKNFYDDAITQGKWWSRLYFKLLWGGVDDNDIARRVLAWIPDDFTGNMLDVPVGTAVFTAAKYKQMTKADITCLDYSTDMLERAEQRMSVRISAFLINMYQKYFKNLRWQRHRSRWRYSYSCHG